MSHKPWLTDLYSHSPTSRLSTGHGGDDLKVAETSRVEIVIVLAKWGALNIPEVREQIFKVRNKSEDRNEEVRMSALRWWQKKQMACLRMIPMLRVVIIH